jgi:hypothetical protein
MNIGEICLLLCFGFMQPCSEALRLRKQCSPKPWYQYTYLLTYLLTPWSRVLLEKLTVNFAASQEISRIYGTRKVFTVPTSARHLSLS